LIRQVPNGVSDQDGILCDWPRNLYDWVISTDIVVFKVECGGRIRGLGAWGDAQIISIVSNLVTFLRILESELGAWLVFCGRVAHLVFCILVDFEFGIDEGVLEGIGNRIVDSLDR
jgi:hypothetical protein